MNRVEVPLTVQFDTMAGPDDENATEVILSDMIDAFGKEIVHGAGTIDWMVTGPITFDPMPLERDHSV